MIEYDTFVLDLDGTVYLDGLLFPGVRESIIKLQSRGKQFYFLTNNTSRCKPDYLEKLNAFGFDVEEFGHVITPLDVFMEFCRKVNISSYYGLITSAVRGWILENGGPVYSEKNPQIVLVGFDTELNYEKIRVACSLIENKTDLYLTHIDDACPTARGPIPDCGAIFRLLNSATGVQYVQDFGKPSDAMASYLISNVIGFNDRSAVLGGDRLNTDIALGVKMGVDTVHVSSQESYAELTPTYTYVNLNDFLTAQLEL